MGSVAPPRCSASITTACKKRAEAAAAAPQSSGPAFVELTSPVLVAKQCRLELDNGAGATMRVQLVGYDAADVEALSRSFWNAR